MKSVRLSVVVVTTIGLCLPPVTPAAQPPLTGSVGLSAATRIVQDVALAEGSKLVIQTVDPQGKPHPGTPINIRQAGKTIHQAVTRQDGQVVVPKLKPGIYEVRSGDQGGIYRIWAPRTAPPRVATGILLIDDGGVVRGSRGSWKKGAIVGGVVITSAVLGGVIGYNLNDDDAS